MPQEPVIALEEVPMYCPKCDSYIYPSELACRLCFAIKVDRRPRHIKPRPDIDSLFTGVEGIKV